MTLKEIEMMEAGRDMDVLVLRMVFGKEAINAGHLWLNTEVISENGWANPPSYSSDISSAINIVDHMKRFDYDWRINWLWHEKKWNVIYFGSVSECKFLEESLPLAICKCAIAWSQSMWNEEYSKAYWDKEYKRGKYV